MSEDAEGYFCHFDAQIVHKNFSKPDFSNEFPFLQFAGNPLKTQASFRPVIEPILQLLEAECQQDQPFKLDLVSFLLLALFTELKRFAQADRKVVENSALRITRLYKEALSQFIYQKHAVTEYADLLYVSPNHLNKCVCYGLSLTEIKMKSSDFTRTM